MVDPTVTEKEAAHETQKSQFRSWLCRAAGVGSGTDSGVADACAGRPRQRDAVLCHYRSHGISRAGRVLRRHGCPQRFRAEVAVHPLYDGTGHGAGPRDAPVRRHRADLWLLWRGGGADRAAVCPADAGGRPLVTENDPSRRPPAGVFSRLGTITGGAW